ncbi:MAG: DAK2 domain-containing protein [Thermaerobacter sp.]|nr:DAK2 domain-containing protein [Thermaerobacter sp.]
MGGSPNRADVYLTVQDLERWMHHALEALQLHHEGINRLNVFPVPDGDTGNNMLSTLREAVRRLDEHAPATVSEAWRLLADGALMGARGNSGVILSQLLRGFAESTRSREVWGPKELSQAFRHAYEVAFRQVYHPVEGTVLTVARRMAEVAQGSTLLEILTKVCAEGEAAVADTPRLLPMLRQAGVVDAGGRGYWLIVEAWRQTLAGIGPDRPAQPPTMASAPAMMAAEDVRFPYDTEALIENWQADLPVNEAVHRLAALGDSIVVADGGASVKVHVHTDRPQALLELLFSFGNVVQMELLDMRRQMEHGGFSSVSPSPELTVAVPIAYHPLFEGLTTVSPEQADDQAGVLWVAPARPLENAFAAETVGLAGQLALEYDAADSWEVNRNRFKTMLASVRHVVVARAGQNYLMAGENYPSRDALWPAIRDRLRLTGVVTVYLNQRARHEEAVFWQTKLGAELVQIPAEGVWMEIVEQL